MTNKALSLIELIMGLAITATIAGIVLVQFSLVDRRMLETSARNLLADSCWTRQMAITRHFNYIVDFNTANERYVIFEDRDADGVPDANEEVKRRQLQVNLVSVTDFSGVIQTRVTFFFPQGTAADRIITLRQTNRERPVRIFGETGYSRLDPLTIL